MKIDTVLIFLLMSLTHNKILDQKIEYFVIHPMLLTQVVLLPLLQKKQVKHKIGSAFLQSRNPKTEKFSLLIKNWGWARAKSENEEKISLFWGAPQGARGAARD